MTKKTDTGDAGLAVAATGSIGYLVALLLPDGASGFWGVVCEVLTLWGWGLVASVALFAVLALVSLLSARFTRAPHWVVTSLAASAFVVAAPVLVVVFLLCALFGGADNGGAQTSSEF